MMLPQSPQRALELATWAPQLLQVVDDSDIRAPEHAARAAGLTSARATYLNHCHSECTCLILGSQ